MTEWPLLIIDNYLFWHYKLLVGHEIADVTNGMIKQYEKIFTFNDLKFHSKTMIRSNEKKSRGKNTNNTANEVDAPVATKGTVSLFQFEKTTDEEIMFLQVLDIVASHFGEKINFLCVECETSELEQLDSLELPDTPCLLRAKDSNPIEYRVIIDKVAVWYNTDFVKAFQYFFASTYVFNRIYNDNLAATLLFVEMYASPIRSKHRSKARHHTVVLSKVMGLYNKLRDVNVPTSSSSSSSS
ncbi:uncharacterized protein LOC122497889 [Leptopilina heterotoma]|uniref:uncharacterized protein LOC122497889 n=1 Tax=Leptopilina heterotoma TaxID=63436 RepID=UPI001CA8F882|nr:uncharacterized protein LOC122497889 [Leptopilina heterotoma]